MEAAFENLKKNGQNNVDNLMQWMQNSKIIDEDSEEKARALLKDADQENVELNEFQEAVQKLALEQHKSLADFSKKLAEQTESVSSLSDAMEAGVSALKDAFK